MVAVHLKSSIKAISVTGAYAMPVSAQLRSLTAPKSNKAEAIKVEKGGHRMWEDVHDLGEKIRSGQYKWEDLALDDLDVRLKWSGLFHRKKRAPGTYMMRLKVCCARSVSAQGMRGGPDTH